jgi:hypothetical protein
MAILIDSFGVMFATIAKLPKPSLAFPNCYNLFLESKQWEEGLVNMFLQEHWIHLRTMPAFE